MSKEYATKIRGANERERERERESKRLRRFVKFLFSFFLFVTLFFTTHTSVFATNRYVNVSASPYVGTQGTYGAGNDTTGNGTLSTPWASMKKAEASATAADTVYVAAGTYHEYDATASRCANYTQACNTLGVDKQLDWIADGTVIVGTGLTSSVNAKMQILPNANNITFTGFTFDGSRPSTTDSVNTIEFEAGAGPVTFTNCVIKNAQDNTNLVKMNANTDATFTNTNFLDTNDTSDPGWIDFTGHSLTVSGGTVTTGSNLSGNLFYAHSAVTGTISITGVTINESTEGSTTMIKITEGVFSPTLQNNILNGTGAFIAMDGQSTVLVSGNTLNDSVSTAINGIAVLPSDSQSSSSTTQIINNTLNFPLMDSAKAITVGTEETSTNDNKQNGAIISGNILNLKETGSTSTHGIHIGHLTSAYVFNNTILGGFYGIVVEHTQNNPWVSGGIYRNVVRNADHSILLKGPQGVPVSNNSFYCDGVGCISLVYSTAQTGGYEPVNNIIKNNAMYLLGGSTSDYIYEGYNTGYVYDYNAIYATGTYKIATGYTTWANWTGRAEAPDAHSINLNPLFVSPSTNYFNLQRTSPAINVGTNIDGVTQNCTGTCVDKAGNAMIGTPDIGAYEYIPLTVTIDQKSDQSDPTNSSTINFTVIFSESVSDFSTGDVTLSGTVGATTATITGSGTTYNVAVTGMTGSGTVIASLAAGVATGATSNTNAISTSTDNTVTYDVTAPTITIGTPTPNSTGATIVWTTNEDSSSKVDYGLTNSYGNSTTETDTPTGVISHSVALSSLSSCTTYHYRVRSIDTALNETIDSDNYFITTGCTSSSSSSNNNSSSTSTTVCNDQTPGSKAPWLYGAIAQDSGSVLLYFTEAENPVNKYVLEYGTKSGDYPYGVQDMGVNSRGQMTFLVKSLSPNTTYYFRVRGGNGCATGSWSNEISAKTKGLVSFNQLEITQSQLETQPVTEIPSNTSCQTYTVKSGDTLWSIAKNLLGDGNKYKEIIEQNKDTHSSLETSNNLRSGWEVKYPAAETAGSLSSLKINCVSQTTEEIQKTTEAPAQGGYDVKVKVVDTAKKPVEGATVTLHSNPQTTKTDKNGIASFTNVEAGDHKVLIAYNNFEGEQSVNLTGDVKEFDLNVTVQQKAISLSPLVYGIIGIMGLVIIGLIVLVIKLKRKE